MEHLTHTKNWVKNIVIGLNLCPFAASVFGAGKIRFVLSEAENDEALLADFVKELDYLVNTSADDVETTLIVHPKTMSSFEDYLDFLSITEAVLEEADLDGVVQVASFHPDYQFAGTDKDDSTNYTNRSPYPMLHLLREESVSDAIDNHPDPDAIPEKNIALMEKLGLEKIQKLRKNCLIDET